MNEFHFISTTDEICRLLSAYLLWYIALVQVIKFCDKDK